MRKNCVLLQSFIKSIISLIFTNITNFLSYLSAISFPFMWICLSNGISSFVRLFKFVICLLGSTRKWNFAWKSKVNKSNNEIEWHKHYNFENKSGLITTIFSLVLFLNHNKTVVNNMVSQIEPHLVYFDYKNLKNNYFFKKL